MPDFKLMTYNIEWMNRMFENGTIKPEKQDQARSVARVITSIHPHILGICEAANERAEHEHFIREHLDGSYTVALGASRGQQNLVFYSRSPVRVVSINSEVSYYDPWIGDVDEDGLDERHKWERKPLEAVFELGQTGPRMRVILVHAKSKIVSSVVDLQNFQKIALANRKKLVAQARQLRTRLNELLRQDQPIPTVVLGDMNDGPGLDPFEKMVGTSFVETVMGSVFEPDGIFHNVLYWMTHAKKKIRDQLWTSDFPDPIVSSPFGQRHRIWLDHILVSPDMLSADNPVRYVFNSGRIGNKDKVSKKASDHFPVYCTLQTG